MIQKAVHFQHAAGSDMTVFSYSVFQKFHKVIQPFRFVKIVVLYYAEEQNARDFYKKRPSFCKKTGFVRFYPPKSSKTAVRFPQIVIFCAAGTPELIFRRQNGILINENNGQRKEI